MQQELSEQLVPLIDATVQRFDAERGSFIHLLSCQLKTASREACGCRTSKRDALMNSVSLDAPTGSMKDGLILAEIVTDSHDDIAQAEEDAFQVHLARTVRGAVARLPVTQREALTAYYFDGMAYAAINALHNYRSERAVQRDLAALRRGKDAACLYELLYGTENLYRGTGLLCWRNTGCSVQELVMIRHEEEQQRYELSSRAGEN